MKEKTRLARVVSIIVVLVILASLCLAVNVSPVSAQPAITAPPEVTTGSATFVTTNSANLNGHLVDLGTASSVDVSLEWGATTAYGFEAGSHAMTAPSSFAVGIGDLAPGTTYHYRAKGVGDGTAYGNDKTFTTNGEPSEPPIVTVIPVIDIDIKPWSYPNSINLKAKGVIPVAILTNDTFDSTTVDPDTVVFADAAPVHSAIEDVDDDGDMDMILHFKTQETDIEPGDTEASLTGETYDGVPLVGIDSVRTVGK